MRIKPEETIQIQGPYGRINGILTPCIEENTAAPMLVLAHGFRGSMDGGGRAAVLAEMASECCNVIRFNFNGSQILSKQVEELEAVLAYVRLKFSAGKIFLLGRSLGGAAALVAASRSLILQGWYCGLRRTIYRRPSEMPWVLKPIMRYLQARLCI